MPIRYRCLQLQWTALFSTLLFLAGCGQSRNETIDTTAPPLSELVVQKMTEIDLTTPDPQSEYWQHVPQGQVPLYAQPMVAPRPEKTTTEMITVQAIHNDKRVAFRIRWKDPDESQAGRLGEFSDGVALEFPIKSIETTPVMMGAKDNPVHIFHWRAQYQRDMEKGKPEIKDIYPHASIDMYPLEFKEAKGGTPAEQMKFYPGKVAGNPQAFAKNGVDEIIAEGFSTSSVQAGHGSNAKGEWKNGIWTIVIVRPMFVEKSPHIAFAVWQGGQKEVGSRKSVAMSWLKVKVM